VTVVPDRGTNYPLHRCSKASNGRTTLTGGGGKNPVLYLIGPNQAFVVGTDKNVFSGMLVPQSGSDFTNASLSGIYLGGTQQPVSWSVDTEVDYVNAGGNGTATITYDDDGSGGPTSGGGSFTYAVSSNGRVVVTDCCTERLHRTCWSAAWLQVEPTRIPALHS
jgi:hypothetical protein